MGTETINVRIPKQHKLAKKQNLWHINHNTATNSENGQTSKINHVYGGFIICLHFFGINFIFVLDIKKKVFMIKN
jgi:hypothetical protein